MPITSLLVSNRGEIAIRVFRAAADLGIRTVAVYPEDDATSLHVLRADHAVKVPGKGAAAYLDIEAMVAAAKDAGCDAIHPGYGFLSENAAFGRRCEEEGITFVGPKPAMLAELGDKARARALAASLGVPVLPGTQGATTLEEAAAFLESLGPGGAIMVKAIAGGGGRGMRLVDNPAQLEQAFTRCQSEAKAAFGNGDVYIERYIPRARHVEVQVLGDGTGAVSHFWERECSLQRRNQKLVEIAPSPTLSANVRERLTESAVRVASSIHYRSAGTFEFLVDAENPETVAFIEANARLQVEHTVTEAITGIDIVQAQLRIAGGETLADLGVSQEQVPAPHGFAIQARVNMETMRPDGMALPSGGTFTAFEAPGGPGVRVDTFGYAGYTSSPFYDSLVAKVIVHAPGSFADAARKTRRALAEFRVDGVATNIPFLRAVLAHPDVVANDVYTRFIEEHAKELAAAALDETPPPAPKAAPAPAAAVAEPAPAARATALAGAKIDTSDPLAVLHHGKQESDGPSVKPATAEPADGLSAVRAPLQGTIVSIDVKEGEAIRPGQQLLVMEAMKMQHVISAEAGGYVRRIEVSPGDAVMEGATLIAFEPADVGEGEGAAETAIDPDYIRPDLQLIVERHAITLDAARPDAVEKRRKTGQRTARENIDDLCDPGTFIEHGSLVLTPATGLPMDEVIRKFPTDGMITGVGSINGASFDAPATQCAILSYDYTVLAGTQGAVNHPKTDRMFELAEKWRLPVIIFTEGGGGRAGTGGNRTGAPNMGNTPDVWGGRPLDTPTFATMGRLSGTVPVIGINSGRCFAGNAALLGCCDVIIATANSNIGMGGPAMIEGGGLGIFRPEEVGPMSIQVPNGVVDIAVADEEEAVAAAKLYLSYFQGTVREWEAPDQRLLRHAIPENRLRVYDIRKVIETLADKGSVLELRRHFGPGMITAFIRIEGRPVGLIANNPMHLAGAIDSDGADKAARFMQLLDAFDIPLLVLCDTPGMMVGPEVEKTGLVRHCSRMFVTGANLSIPHMTVVLRKAYGLGAQAMAGGSFKEPFFAVAWPTGEFGGMGLEGQVKLGFRNELAMIETAEARVERYNDLVARAYERSKAIHQGVSFGVDDVIDPKDTRHWVLNGLRSVRTKPRGHEKKRANVDTW